MTIFLLGKYLDGEVKLMEPKKFEVWDWFEWNNLPEPLFIPINNLISQGYSPFKTKLL